MRGLLYSQPYLAGGRRTEICWSMGTKTFAVFERIPQNCISGSVDERQTEQLSGRYRGIGTGNYRAVKGAENALEWIGRMNNIQACAREIVDKEIIYQ